jgi:indolepyruvate ferredoxin oxidoreductase, beta subunit
MQFSEIYQMDKSITNVIMVGVGGQGTILASEILAEAALKSGQDVRKSEIHGMAQRGGSVSSHIRFGHNVKSPLIEMGQADIMLTFEKVESLRYADMMRDGAKIIMNDLEIVPTTVSLGVSKYPDGIEKIIRGMGFELIEINALELAQKAGNPKTANVVLLAKLASLLEEINKEIWVDVIKRRVPSKFLDVNLKAFELGYGALAE